MAYMPSHTRDCIIEAGRRYCESSDATLEQVLLMIGGLILACAYMFWGLENLDPPWKLLPYFLAPVAIGLVIVLGWPR